MFPWLFRLVCAALVTGAVVLGGLAHAAEPYGVGPRLCGSLGNVMAKVAILRETGAPFDKTLAGRREGAAQCRADAEVSKLGCPSDTFIIEKTTEAWNMAVDKDAATVGEHFYEECLKANGVKAEEPNLGKRL